MTRRQCLEPLATTSYDVIIVGTGLCESMLAAALAVAGASVLHLDSNAFYGAVTASLTVSALDDLLDPAEDLHADLPSPAAPTPAHQDHATLQLPNLPPTATLFPYGACLLRPHPHFSRPSASVTSAAAAAPPSAPHSSPSAALIDLAPAPLLAAGRLVDLLVRTRVGHYLDFRALDALYLCFPGARSVQRVPASRADVFQHRFLSVVEKRLLARFVKSCLDFCERRNRQHSDDAPHDARPDASLLAAAQPPSSSTTASPSNAPPSQKPMLEVLQESNLTDNLRTFLTHAFLQHSDPVTARASSSSASPITEQPALSYEDGCRRLKVFSQSLARFATPTPFLYTNYGSGELAQAFCRLCAVASGTYVLRRGAAALVRPPDDSDGRDEATPRRIGVHTTEGDVLSGAHVFLSRALGVRATDHSGRVGRGPRGAVWRFAGVVDKALLRPDLDVARVALYVPAGTVPGVSSAMRVLQVDSSLRVCPPGLFILYVQTVSAHGSEADLLACVRWLVDCGDAHDDGNVNDRAGAEWGGGGVDVAGGGHGLAASDGAWNDAAEASPLDEERPRLMWGMSYARDADEGVCSFSDELPEVVYVPSVEGGFDFDDVISTAESLFRRVFPDGDFLPDRRENERPTATTATSVGGAAGIANGHVDGVDGVAAGADGSIS